MIWYYGSGNEIEDVVCTNEITHKTWQINVSKTALSNLDAITEELHDNIDCRYINATYRGDYPTAYFVGNVLKESVSDYYESDEVHRFYIGDKEFWLNASQRASLLNSLNCYNDDTKLIELYSKQDELVYLTIHEIRELIKQLDNYSRICYSVYKDECNRINELTNSEDNLNTLLHLDITEGFPEVIRIDVESETEE